MTSFLFFHQTNSIYFIDVSVHLTEFYIPVDTKVTSDKMILQIGGRHLTPSALTTYDKYKTSYFDSDALSFMKEMLGSAKPGHTDQKQGEVTCISDTCAVEVNSIFRYHDPKGHTIQHGR